MTEVALQPKYARGQTVRYADRHGRAQTGTITSIDGHWTSYGLAFVTYDVTHPTYRGYHMFATENDILSVVTTEGLS